MFCRRICHRVGPLARRLFSPTSRNTVPVRHMAFGVPGGSTNLTYFVLCGGGLTAAVVYAYKTVNGDTERYEDRLANMNSQAKVEEAPEAAAPAAEPAASEEEPASEIIAESVPVEPVEEIPAEPAGETAAVEVSEVVTAEASAVSEEAAPVVVEEAALEAAPEVPVEAPAAESADLLTAVKILASSTVEIAAASVGEEILVEVAHQNETDGKSTTSTYEVPDSEAAPETTIKEEEDVIVSKEEKSEDVQNPAADEVTTEVNTAPAAAQEEEGGSSPSEETSSVEKADGEDGAEVALEKTVQSIETTYEDASSSEETEGITVTSATSKEETPTGETSAEKPGTAVTTQLAAASTGPDLDVLSAAETEPPASEGPVMEGECCHSCHVALLAGEEVSPPGESLFSKEDMDPKHQAMEEKSLLE